MRRFPANPFAQPSAPSRGGVPPSRASPPAPLGWRGPPLGACQISFFLAPTWTGEGEGSGLFDAAPRLRFAPSPRPLPFPASGPTGARPLAPFTYGICTRTEQGKKNKGQEQEQKTQNTGVGVLSVAQCAAADGRRQTADARCANTNDQPWATDTSYRVCYHQSYTTSTTEEARDQVTPFVSSIQCPIEGGEFEQKETILLPS